MCKKDVLTIGINGAGGVGKTTLIERLCVELRDEYEIGVLTELFSDSQSEVTHDETSASARRTAMQRSLFLSRTRIDQYQRSIVSRSTTRLLKGRSVKNLLLIEGNADRYEQWMKVDLISDLIQVVDINQHDSQDWINEEFVEKAGLLVVNKLDLLELTTPRFINICLQAQAMRGFNPWVFSSMHTGFGLDLIVAYIKQRIAMRKIMGKYNRL